MKWERLRLAAGTVLALSLVVLLAYAFVGLRRAAESPPAAMAPTPVGAPPFMTTPILPPPWPPGKATPKPYPTPTPTPTLVPAPTAPVKPLPTPAVAPIFRSQNITVTREVLFAADVKLAAALWSPDGTRIMFAPSNGQKLPVGDAQPAQDFYLRDLMLISPEGTGLTRLANNAVYYDWSRNGTQIVYTSYVSEKQSDIFVIKSDGSGLKKIGSGDVARAQFLPNGHVVYVKDHFLNEADPASGSSSRLNSFFMENFERIELTPQVIRGPRGDYRVSPDGKRVAYQNMRALYVMNLDGSGLVQLTAASSFLDSFAWSPDGSLIAYGVAQQGQKSQLWVAAADGSASQSIYDDMFQVGAQSWSLDGNVILAMTKSKSFVLNRDGSNLQVLSGEGLPRSSMGNWSPNGDKMLVRQGDRIGVAFVAH